MNNLFVQSWVRSLGAVALIAGSFFALHAAGAAGQYEAGSLITCGNNRAVYYVAEDGHRYVFPTKQTYISWYPHDKQYALVQNATIVDCQQISFGGNITKRPGMYLVKLPYDAAVYAVDFPNVLRHVGDAAIARTWFPSTRRNLPDQGWERQLRTEPEQFWNDYVMGASITSADDFDPTEVKEMAPTIESLFGGTVIPPTLNTDPQPTPVPTPDPQPTPESIPIPDPQPTPTEPRDGLEIGGRNPVPSAHEQGGNFRTLCSVSHFNYDDPLVYPGDAGRSHLHMFFGNTAVDAFTTAHSLVNTGEGSCNGGALNRTGYWVPTMLDTAGNPAMPLPINVYYKSASLDHTAIQPMPNGLRMISGNAHASPSNPQDRNVGLFSCLSTYTNQFIHIPNCPLGDTLIMQLSFPQCWDGVNLDSADHKSHLAYAEWTGIDQVYACPTTHPIGLAQLTYVLDFPVNDANGTASWKLASDTYTGAPGGHSIHGDWMMAWDRQVIETWTRECINAGRDCSNGEMGDGTRLIDVQQQSVILPSPPVPDTSAPTSDPVPTSDPTPDPVPVPTPSAGNISVTADGAYVTWTIDGMLGQAGGTMMVFGLSSQPTHNSVNTTAYYRPYQSVNDNAWVNDIYGSGTYYVRVCSYDESDDTCSDYSNEVTVVL